MSVENILLSIAAVASVLGHILSYFDRRHLQKENEKKTNEPIQLHLFVTLDPTGKQHPTVSVYQNRDYTEKNLTD